MRALPISGRRAFTLIELLVVVAILALLLGIFAPALEGARQRAKESVCGSQLRGMMVGIQGYMTEYHDYFPPYGQAILYGPKLEISTAYAAVMHRGKYSGPTWCPNVAEASGSFGSLSADVAFIRGDKQKRYLGYTYNLQVGNLIQDPTTGEFIYYNPHGEGEEKRRIQALPARMYTELERPAEFALMGCGRYLPPWGGWVDSSGVIHAIPSFVALHGRYFGYRFRGVGLSQTGPRERGNITMADGHVESFPELWEVDRYAEKHYLWPHRDY